MKRQILKKSGQVLSGTVMLATLDSYFRSNENTQLKEQILNKRIKNERLSIEIERLSSEIDKVINLDNQLEMVDIKLNKLDADLMDKSNNVQNECDILNKLNSKLFNENELNQNELSELNNDLVHHT